MPTMPERIHRGPWSASSYQRSAFSGWRSAVSRRRPENRIQVSYE